RHLAECARRQWESVSSSRLDPITNIRNPAGRPKRNARGRGSAHCGRYGQFNFRKSGMHAVSKVKHVPPFRDSRKYSDNVAYINDTSTIRSVANTHVPAPAYRSNHSREVTRCAPACDKRQAYDRYTDSVVRPPVRNEVLGLSLA